MRLLLTEPVPFRKMSELGAFASTDFLSERYGDLRRSRFKCQRITPTKHAAANHPMEISEVFVGDLKVKTFATGTEAAPDGRPYQVINFNAPVPIGTDVTARGVGKRNAVTGALIENPADILTDVMAMGGRSDAWWGGLRSEASVASITLAGSFPGTLTSPSIRDVLDAIVDSCGAFWCPGMARLYPVPFGDSDFKIDLDRLNAWNVRVSASLTDTFDILKLSYDYDEAEGRTQGFMQLEARPQRYGGVDVALALPMVRSAALAEAIGRRLLSRGAGERYDVELDTKASEFTRPGTWALLSDNPQWPFASNPYLMLTQATIQRRAKRAHLIAETIVSTPTIVLTKHTVGGNSIGEGGVEIDERDGVATITVFDPKQPGKPLVGAYVALDGGAPKKTNGQGQVAFIVTQTGQHTLDIAATGYASAQLTITL